MSDAKDIAEFDSHFAEEERSIVKEAALDRLEGTAQDVENMLALCIFSMEAIMQDIDMNLQALGREETDALWGVLTVIRQERALIHDALKEL